VSAITSELARLSGPLAYLVVAALVFGETALFFGFVLPGEIAVVLGGVLASRGRAERCLAGDPCRAVPGRGARAGRFLAEGPAPIST
jgi:hypothetical protein